MLRWVKASVAAVGSNPTRRPSAVQHQEIAAIVADHATNFLMFDVPPPNELNGIDAYRESWTPFFEHFKHGGVFAIERLDVTAGDQVAFATALLRCGTKEELARASFAPIQGVMLRLSARRVSL